MPLEHIFWLQSVCSSSSSSSAMGWGNEGEEVAVCCGDLVEKEGVDF